MARVRFGLIGYGAWGSHHARAIAAHPDAELVAIASASEKSRAAASAGHPGAAIFGDYRELVGRPEIDVVVIVLPTHLHFEAAGAALRAGKHVLLEKPMALELADCDALIALAREKGRLLAIGHELRLSSLWGKVRELLTEGAVGEPRYVLIELWRRPYRTGSDGWRYDPARVGSWILEEPIHFFDFACWYLEPWARPVSVCARASAGQDRGPQMQDNFSAVVNFSNGAYAVVSQTLAAYEHHQVVKITGTGGALWASWSGAMDRTFCPTFSLKRFKAGGPVEDVPITRLTGEVYELSDQVENVIRALREGKTLSCRGEDGRRSVALCLAAMESIKLGRGVEIEA